MVLFMASCKGDEGDPGPAGKDGKDGIAGTNGTDGVDGEDGTNGTDGVNGTNGENGANGAPGQNGANGQNGTNGANGTNGIGFEESTQFGNITLKLTGTRPDGVAFTKSLDFKFAPSNVYWSTIFPSGRTSTTSQLKRYSSFGDSDTDEENNSGYVMVVLRANAESDYRLNMHLKTSITTPDFKYFNMNDGYYNVDNINISDLSVVDYSYTSGNGELKYTMRFMVDGQNNSTGYPLSVELKTNAIVFQNASPLPDFGRTAGRINYSKPEKAVMHLLN
jgi:hypothetical protein